MLKADNWGKQQLAERERAEIRKGPAWQGPFSWIVKYSL